LAPLLVAVLLLCASAVVVRAEEPANAQTELASGSALRAALVRLDARERELRRDVPARPMRAPATLLGLGLPAALVLVPIGALLVADSVWTQHDEYSAGYMRERVIGSVLLTAGVAFTAAAIWGAVTIHKRRRKVRLAESELRAISVQRMVLAEGVVPSLDDAAPPRNGIAFAELDPPRGSGPSWTARGRTLLTGSIGAQLASGDDIGGRRWGLNITPGFARFVRDRLAVGGFLTFARSDAVYSPGEMRRDFTLGGGVRMIRDIQLGERTSLWLWPYAAVAWTRSHFSHQPTQVCPVQAPAYLCHELDSSDRSRLLLRFGVELPLMFQLTKSWGVGAGPYFEYAYGVWGADIEELGLSSHLVGSF
jgi:hypothetical protein